MGFCDDTKYIPTNELLSQAVDSTSLFGPCYFEYSKVRRIVFYRIEAKYYCCFFNHIINPFSEEGKYKKDKKKKFLSYKLLGDHECEIGYIPVNQEYEKVAEGIDGIYGGHSALEKYCYERTIENFKQNMLNDPNIKNPKLHVFFDDKIIDLK